MKADVADAEKEAALEYVKSNLSLHQAGELTKEGSKRFHRKDCVRLLVSTLRHDSKFELDVSAVLEAVRDGWQGITVRDVCAAASILIAHGDPLSTSLREFLVEFLRDPDKWMKAGKRGPSGYDLKWRDMIIAGIIGGIVRGWKFPATRNDATERPSAASIVHEALVAAGIDDLQEKAINRFGTDTAILTVSRAKSFEVIRSMRIA
jgi:hypothetical protein